MTWKHIIIITWGGLRGAVGLALALVVVQTASIDIEAIGSKVVLYYGMYLHALLSNSITHYNSGKQKLKIKLK